MHKSLEIVVMSEWTTSRLWCATFLKPRRTLLRAVPERRGGFGVHREVLLRAGDGGLVWSIDGKSSKDKNQYLQAGWKFPQLPSWLSGGVWLLFFSAVFYSGCPLSLARIPHSLCLLWSSLSYRLKKKKKKESSRSESHAIGNLASTTWSHTYFTLGAVTFSIVPH